MRKVPTNNYYIGIYENKSGVQYGISPAMTLDAFTYHLAWSPNEETTDTFHISIIPKEVFEAAVASKELKLIP